jgi:hypothetical protein
MMADTEMRKGLGACSPSPPSPPPPPPPPLLLLCLPSLPPALFGLIKSPLKRFEEAELPLLLLLEEEPPKGSPIPPFSESLPPVLIDFTFLPLPPPTPIAESRE